MTQQQFETILVTGGAGFIGSNFISYFLARNKNIRVVNLDLLTYAGDLNNLEEVESNCRYIFVQGDICNRKLIEELFVSRFLGKNTKALKPLLNRLKSYVSPL